jgi:serine/threonine-protein kinase RsbW
MGSVKYDDRTGRSAARGCREELHGTAELLRVVEAVSGAMAEQRYRESDIFQVRLALEEAVSNAVRHGHRGDASKVVRVWWDVRPDRVLAEVEDQGDGFDPGRVADPLAPENLEREGGRGLFLMRYAMTWVRYSRRGNRVALCKHRSAR